MSSAAFTRMQTMFANNHKGFPISCFLIHSRNSKLFVSRRTLAAIMGSCQLTLVMKYSSISSTWEPLPIATVLKELCDDQSTCSVGELGTKA